MISKDKILDYLDNGIISIKYLYRPQKDSASYELISTNESEESIARTHNQIFRQNLINNRMKITVGPIIKTLSKKYISSECRFNKFPYLFDLRENNGKYKLQPKESIIILSNEKIGIKEKICGHILPRVHSYSYGLTATPSYIEPNWNGLLRIQLTNFSDEEIEICIAQDIARLYFFEVFNPITSLGSTHHANCQDWSTVFSDGVDPFPNALRVLDGKKKKISLKKILDNAHDIVVKYSGYSLVVILAIIISFFLDYKPKFKDIEENSKKIEMLSTAFHLSGRTNIIFNPNEIIKEKTIKINKQLTENQAKGVVLLQPETYINNVKLTGEINGNELKIRACLISESNEQQTISVIWAIIP